MCFNIVYFIIEVIFFCYAFNEKKSENSFRNHYYKIFILQLLSKLFKIDLTNPIPPPPSVKFDWNKFNLNNSNLSFPDMNNPSDIDSAAKLIHLQNIINAQKHASFHKFKNKNTFVLPLPTNIGNLCKQRNILHRFFQSSRDPSLKRL